MLDTAAAHMDEFGNAHAHAALGNMPLTQEAVQTGLVLEE